MQLINLIQMKNKHVVISEQSFGNLDQLASNWDMDYKEFLENAINYFKATGEDPRATKKDNMVRAMKELQNTFISFIRTHEKDHLIKLVQDFETTRKSLEVDSKKTSSEIIKELQDFMYKGWEYEDKDKQKQKWSIAGALNSATLRDKAFDEKVKNQHDETIKRIDTLKSELAENRKDKKQLIESEINKKMQEIEQWGTLSTDGNKGKAKNLLSELKTLINASY